MHQLLNAGDLRVEGGSDQAGPGKWRATCRIYKRDADGFLLPATADTFDSAQEATSAGVQAGIAWVETNYPRGGKWEL